jgi:hypothetical protein
MVRELIQPTPAGMVFPLLGEALSAKKVLRYATFVSNRLDGVVVELTEEYVVMWGGTKFNQLKVILLKGLKEVKLLEHSDSHYGIEYTQDFVEANQKKYQENSTLKLDAQYKLNQVKTNGYHSR